MKSIARLFAAALVVSLALVWIDIRAVASLLAEVPLRVVALGIALGLLRTALLSLRWSVLDGAIYEERAARDSGEARGVTKLSQWDYFRYRLANATANLFLPSALGADAARAALVVGEIADDKVRRVLVIFFDRFLGILSISLIGLIAAAVAPDLAHRGAYIAAIGCLNLTLVLILLLSLDGPHQRAVASFASRIGRPGTFLLRVISEVSDCLSTFYRHSGRVVLALALCAAVHLTSFSLVYLAASAIGIQLPFTTLAVMTTLSWVVVLIPVSIGGLGIRELSFVGLLAPQGVAAPEAAAVSLFQFVVIVGVGLLGVPAVLSGRSARDEGDPA